jgi:hypothetical protein
MNWRKSARSNPTWGWKLITNIYDTVHIALWSILIAAIIFFSLFTLPKIWPVQAQLEVQRIQEIAAENRRYCEKWASRWERTSIWRVRLICRNFAQKSSSAPLTACSGSGMDCR